MNDWSNLVRASLLGTERAALPPSPVPLPDGLPPEEALLARAALAAHYARAGTLPATAVTPTGPTSPPDSRAALPDAVTPLLADLLAQEKDTLLRQALAAIARSDRRLPGSALPLLLDAGAEREKLRPLLARIAGPRGRWLAAQREAWRFAAVDPADPAALEAALTPFSGDEIAYLRLAQLLRCAPARGRALAARLLADHAQPSRSRTRLLPVLEEALAPDMEPLLERALDDRLFSMRRQASVMLTSLPESAYSRRMLARLLSALDWEPASGGAAARLSLRAEVTPDEAMQRDYLRRRPRTDSALQSWEVRLLWSAVPLDALAERLEATPAEILAAVARAEQSRVIVRSLITAIGRQQNAAWALALLEAPDVTTGTQVIAAGLLDVLSPDEREALTRRALQTGRLPGAPPPLHPLAAMLRRCTHHWSPAFTLQVFDWLGHFLNSARRGGSDVIFRNTMRDVAPTVDLVVAERLLPDLNAAPLPHLWQPAIDQLTSDLQLRRRMADLLPIEEKKPHEQK